MGFRYTLDRRLPRKTLSSRPSSRLFGLDTALANWTHYVATSAFSTNSLRRWRCCKPTALCNKSCDHVDLLEKLSAFVVGSAQRYLYSC